MTWTTSKPTTEGWYWYRNVNGCIEMVFVREDHAGESVAHFDDMDDVTPIAELGGQWQGPLHPET